LDHHRLTAGESTQSQVREFECIVFVCCGFCDSENKSAKGWLLRFTVGGKNAARIEHPMGAAIPQLRMAVSPGQEKEGYLIVACRGENLEEVLH
jgi:hypothetical protein